MANTLTVTFNYMFLLVRNVQVPGSPLQHVVLLPNGLSNHKLSYPHQASYAIDNQPPVLLSSSDVVVTAQGGPNPSVDSTKLKNLLHMKNVPNANGDGSVRPELLAPGLPDDLGARIWLPAGGTFSAAAPVKGSLRKWHLRDRQGDPDLSQSLADQLVYKLPARSAALQVTDDNGTHPPVAFTSVTFTNDDAPGAPPVIDWRVLEDFVEMYRLCATYTPYWPIPVLDQSSPAPGPISIKGADPERPICGGGQGCQPGDPGCP